MTDEYKQMVMQAWKALGVPRYDERGFVQAVTDLVEERNRLLEENGQYCREN